MARQVVKTLFSSDGQSRVDIFRRDDGLFGFIQLKHYVRPEPEGGYWAPLGPYGTITDTAERAEREAGARVDWLIKTSN